MAFSPKLRSLKSGFEHSGTTLFSKKWLPALFTFCLLPFTFSAQPTPAFSIDELEKRTFNFFWETVDANAQTPDRWPTVAFSSIAATGFGLSANLVGVERGYVTREQAAERTLQTLSFLKNLPQGDAATGMGGHRGFFYHFLDHQKGQRFKDVELSTIDTGLLMAGVLSAQTYFDGENTTETAIREVAQLLFERVEWDWMLNSNYRLSMGWKPESGFLSAEWAGYNEAMILYFLALGSPTHKLPARSWDAWTDTYYFDEFMGREHLNFGPLFGHQYSHVWIDFRGITDEYMAKKGFDYFENSRRATLSNRDFCKDPRSAKGRFPYYSENIWGLTACDGPMDYFHKASSRAKPCDTYRMFHGYNARGAASDYIGGYWDTDDGTIAPTAAGGSIPFAPKECLAALETMWTTYGDSLVGRYGFKDAFNLKFTACGQLPGGWFGMDYLGIDQGPILLMLENYRSGFLWKLMKRNENIVRGMKRAGFRGGWLDAAEPTFIKKVSPAFINQEIPTDWTSRFSKENFRAAVKNGGTPLPYRFFDPIRQNRKTAKPRPELNAPGAKFPLVVILHSDREKGPNNWAQMKTAVQMLANPVFQEKNPCFLLAPQAMWGQYWYNAVGETTGDFQLNLEKPSASMTSLMGLLDSVLAQNPQIDRSRIYLTGWLDGGSGTYDLLMRRPAFFAAAMPVMGRADGRFSEKLAKTPLRIFNWQSGDNYSNANHDRALFESLKKAGAPVEYTEFSDTSPEIWEKTYSDMGNWDWLFLQKK